MRALAEFRTGRPEIALKILDEADRIRVKDFPGIGYFELSLVWAKVLAAQGDWDRVVENCTALYYFIKIRSP